MEREVLKCPCCGAPAPKDKCDYCGAVFKPQKERPRVYIEPMSRVEFEQFDRAMRSDWIVMGGEKEIETHYARHFDHVGEMIDEVTKNAMLEQQIYDRKLLNSAGTQFIINGKLFGKEPGANEKGKNSNHHKPFITRIFSRRGDSNE